MGVNWPAFGGVLMVLFVFGIVYNMAVANLEAKGYDRGYTALLVVLGCGITVLMAGILIGVPNMLIVFACFVASGAPMIWGSSMRYARQREEETRATMVTLDRLCGGQEGEKCRANDESEDTSLRAS